jgi:hypothetical protein
MYIHRDDRRYSCAVLDFAEIGHQIRLPEGHEDSNIAFVVGGDGRMPSFLHVAEP